MMSELLTQQAGFMEKKAFVITVLLLAAALLAAGAIAARKAPEVVRTNLENIPLQIGRYKGTNDVFDQAVYDELNADRDVYRHYRSPDGRVIDLYIGYYGTAKGGRTGHNPYACLPAAGWAIVADKKIRIYTGYTDGHDHINYTVTRKGRSYNVLLHWYQSAETAVLASGFEQNVHRFVSRVLENRSDGAYIQVSMQVEKDGIGQAFGELRAFAQKLFVILPRYWPVEK